MLLSSFSSHDITRFPFVDLTSQLLYNMSSSNLVLMTGGSGFVGSSIALEFLRNGYPVRLAVRSQELAAKFKEGKFAEHQDLLSYAVVKDITAPGAYDEAVKDAVYIVHSASPIPNNVKDNKADLLDPAIQGALGMLRSATKSPSVKRVVITSSVAAHMNPLSPASALGENDWNPTTVSARTHGGNTAIAQ